MSRADRLLRLVQLLRRHRYPVSAAALARELGTSIGSIYRDVQTLRGQGAAVEGEAGIGYVPPTVSTWAGASCRTEATSPT